METTVKVIVEDPLVAEKYRLLPDSVIINEPFFLNGPVAERVAIIDRDPQTGQLRAPVCWSPESNKYSIPADITTPAGIAVSVFGLVLKTLAVFERKDVLEQKIKWAFNSPQLLVVPNAGIWENAFYDRYSRSLQFFSFDADGAIVHTALSRDIVTHETGHAILDALAPALYDALTPQTLALHEAIADLTAVVMSLQSKRIQEWVVHECGGRLTDDTPISRIADQFGQALRQGRSLRDASNPLKIGGEVSDEAHDLCQVLTGAFWDAIVKMHNGSLDKANLPPDSREIRKILGVSALHVGRILFRALDYLPPAETTFADYCRAVLRSDEVGYSEDTQGYRAILRNEFVSRRIVDSAAQLDCRPEQEWVDINLDNIVESDWAAYAFAKKMRKLLKVPSGVPFRLLPRRDVMRRYYTSPGEYDERREVVFQLTWEKPEENRDIPGVPRRRGVFHGTTLVLGGKPDGKGRYPVLSCLTTDRSKEQERARNEAVLRLFERGHLEIGDKQASFNSRPLSPRVFGRVTGDTLRLRGTARLIQLMEFTHE